MLFLAAYIIFFISLAVGHFHAKIGSNDKPIWPAKLIINYLLMGPFTKRRKEIELSRTDFSFREQFMAATVVWFLIIFFTFFIFALFFMPILFKNL